MAQPFVAEIRMMAFPFAPRGWALANGQLMAIQQNQALFSLLGTTYGGDGRITFGLPDLRGRTPLHVSVTHPLGQSAGEESHTLLTTEIPAHTHGAKASSVVGDSTDPTANVLAAESAPDFAYRDAEPLTATALRGGTVAPTGGGQAHENMQPFLTINFCIALQGLFPSRN
jgi:microcystin-dependent protein